MSEKTEEVAAGTPEEAAQPKFQPRNNVKDLNAEARVFIADAMGDLEKYKGYLDVIAQFPDYTPMNCAQIALHRPQATQLFDSKAITEAGGFINKGEKGVPIIAPKWVPGKDGEDGKTFFNIKYMFARDQQHGARLANPKAFSQETVLEAMRQVYDCPAPSTREGMYIVGKHFGLAGAFIEHLPEVPQADNLEETLENCVSYMKDVQGETKRFCFALEKKCGELVADHTQSRNERAAAAFERAAKRETAVPEQTPEAPEPASGAAEKTTGMSAKEKLAAAKAKAEAKNQAAAKPAPTAEKAKAKDAGAR